MNSIDKRQYIAWLISKKITASLDEQENHELTEWLEEDPKNRQLYHKLLSKNYLPDFTVYRRIQVQDSLAKYKKQYHPFSKQAFRRRLSIAAFALLLISLGLSLLLPDNTPLSPAASIPPGSSKALLTLSDGSVCELEKEQKNSFPERKDIIIENNGQEIRYRSILPSSSSLPAKTEYNILKIPIGGEYVLTLSDGTKVWLNSQTTLRYPVRFTGSERNVYLEGEAYFEVTHDEQCPFYVRTQNDVNIQVLGTSFNVRNYEDEQQTETVLEQGSVKIWKNTQTATLTPGTKAVYNKTDETLTTRKVHTELYTAWHQGRYAFEEERVEHILNKLSRWYGTTVFFVDEEAKSLIFSGNIRKYETIENLLKAMEATGSIHFDIKDKTILVYNKKN